MAKTVARVNLSDHLVDTVFTLFDENGKVTIVVCMNTNSSIVSLADVGKTLPQCLPRVDYVQQHSVSSLVKVCHEVGKP